MTLIDHSIKTLGTLFPGSDFYALSALDKFIMQA